MIKCSALGLISLVVMAVSFEQAAACGDKFLVPAQTPQFDQAYAASAPGRVLMYRNAASEVARQVMTDDLKGTLERVGHEVDVVDDVAGLEKALASNDYDIVLADAKDAEGLDLGRRAVVVPVVYEAAWMDVVRLKESYSCVMNAPSRASQLLTVVEEAMALHRQG